LKRNGRSAPSSGDTAWLAKQCEDPQVKQTVLTELESYHKGKLAGFEQVKAVHLQPELFHESLLTPTFKIKRQVAGKYFKDIIEKMYSTPLTRQAVGIKRSSKL
jgi:long-chain acyl-CoA synthetase